MYCDGSNLAYLKFLLPILKDVQRVNKSFESNEADPTKLLQDLVTLVKSLVNKVVLPTSKVDPLHGNIEDVLDPKPYMGYLFEKEIELQREKGISGDQENVLRERCVKFITTLIKQIRQRLPSNVKILQQMSLLSAENTLRVVKGSLIPLMELLQVSPEDIADIDNQWGDITLVKWKEVRQTIPFWSEVCKYRDASDCNPYQKRAEFALSVLVLPHSNAEVERVFSQLNIVKTKLRNRMTTKMVNAILTIRAGLRRLGKSCHDYEIPVDALRKIGTLQAYSEAPQPSTSTSGVAQQLQEENDGDFT